MRITEIYKSIQGESTYAGFPCVFVRTTGCSLRCRWCDTSYAFQGGTEQSAQQVLEQIKALHCSLVEFTGGEPLEQEDCLSVMAACLAEGFKVLLETSGAVSIQKVPKGVHIIMDVKCPDSNMAERNLYDNFHYLKSSDEVKFVVASEADFAWAETLIAEHALDEKCQVLISPAFALMKNEQLAALVCASKRKLRMQLQLHKYIWHPRAKGV